MAEERRDARAGGGALLDMEKELTCSICTDVLFQPLTLLDCLHTFCGSCLKEWFAWQAASASQQRRSPQQQRQPYTCPSCRESVRGTRADWRLATLLEAFLHANPDKGKTDEEKEEMRTHYKAGENVIPEVQYRSEEHDSEDERLVEQVREMSMARIDPDVARRRAERRPRAREDRRRQDGAPDHLPLTEARLRERDGDEHRVEHQSSLRSLLSASPVDSHDVQQEILQSIYSEGLLDGIDLENLTTEQEEELTERIAEAYRRRQRRRDRSSNRERTQQNNRPPQPRQTSTQPRPRTRSRTDVVSEQRTTPPRSRPPITRPHVFDQSALEDTRDERRDPTVIGQQNIQSGNPAPSRLSIEPIHQASRSATDLSQRPRTAEAERRRVSSNPRSATDPGNEGLRTSINRTRASSSDTRVSSHPSRSTTTTSTEMARHERPSINSSSPSLTPAHALPVAPPQTVRPAISSANFAPEPISPAPPVRRAPSIKCDRCNKAEIQYDLHYRCPWCRNGQFNICLSCYRDGKGCDHWYGFGYMAHERWHRLAPPEGWAANQERPHVLSPRAYLKYESPNTSSQLTDHNTAGASTADVLQEGAFCENCHVFANGTYWYCAWCLEGAWGICNTCLERGAHCTHPLLPITHISKIHSHPSQSANRDPSSLKSIIQLPHLRPDSYTVTDPPGTDCDLCRRPVAPEEPRYHCYVCSDGDYDICTSCYDGLVATNKITRNNGPAGWRRCLASHRMAIVAYHPSSGSSSGKSGGGNLRRVTIRGPVGGWRLKENVPPSTSSAPSRDPLSTTSSSATNTGGGGLGESSALPPSDASLGLCCLASWSRFPGVEVQDELTFPKNAEIREVEELNADWYLGVYAGKVGLFPSNHVRKLER